ncbi:MAG TPA: DUF6350 family protein [Nakamurella sp.]
MLRDLAPDLATAARTDDQPPAAGLVVAAAAVRGAVVAAAGVLLAAGLALMIWAVTPASGPDAAVALRGGITAFALANLMPVSIGGVTLSLPPLMLTAVPVALLSLTARRGRYLPVGRYQEAVAVLTTAGVYGLVVAAITRGYSSPDAVPAAWVWTAFVLAFVATAAGVLHGDSAWSRWAIGAVPGWGRAGVRGGLVGTVALTGAGALALSCGLILRFGTAVDISAAAAPSWLDGLGMTMLGLAYLPNAVVAAVGYLSGVGFEIGPGTYSPLNTSTVDLPGVPLLAAAPQHDGRTLLGLACLAVPPLVGYLVARPAVRRLVTRADRVAAASVGALLAGAAVAAMALVAAGGVGDGRWSTMGVPALLVGPLIAAEVGVVAVLVAAVTGWRTVPWRIRDIGTDPADPARRRSGRKRKEPSPSAPRWRTSRRRRTHGTVTSPATTSEPTPESSESSPGSSPESSPAGSDDIADEPGADDIADEPGSDDIADEPGGDIADEREETVDTSGSEPTVAPGSDDPADPS